MYKLLTYPLSMLLALCWGVSFASVAFTSVYICTPLLRYLTITMHVFRKINELFLSGESKLKFKFENS